MGKRYCRAPATVKLVEKSLARCSVVIRGTRRPRPHTRKRVAPTYIHVFLFTYLLIFIFFGSIAPVGLFLED